MGSQTVVLRFFRNRRARRYVLRVLRDGSARVTVPARGTLAEARAFAERQASWIERQLRVRAQRAMEPQPWTAGSEILLRGEPVKIETSSSQSGIEIQFGGERILCPESMADLRPLIESHLWRVAKRELPARAQDLAEIHQLPLRRVSVRNQKSRWGSCSRKGTISLNWRLIQTPQHVRDYIILHELAHLQHMNHSARFWQEVARLCPEFKAAERWLKEHRQLLWAGQLW